MNLSEFKNRLKSYSEQDIIITKHAELQAFSRNVEIKEIRNNILKADLFQNVLKKKN
jgi:hypothetical protein